MAEKGEKKKNSQWCLEASVPFPALNTHPYNTSVHSVRGWVSVCLSACFLTPAGHRWEVIAIPISPKALTARQSPLQVSFRHDP